jgi:hypothetical protein
VQLLSRRPEKATSREAARAQLWLNSFDDSIRDLVSESCRPLRKGIYEYVHIIACDDEDLIAILPVAIYRLNLEHP